MKKFLCMILIFLIAGMIFAAGEQEGETDNVKASKLEIWSTLSQEARATEFENIALAYEEDNPGVDVEITVMPWGGAFDKIVAAIMAGNPPDLAIVGQGWPQSLAGTGGLAVLDDVIDAVGGPDVFLGTSLSVLGSFEGAPYALPIYVTPHIVMYRDSWLADAGIQGVPNTWEKFAAAVEAVTDADNNRYGFAMPFADIHGGKAIWGFLLANGVEILAKDSSGNWYLDIEEEKREEAVETYQCLYDMLKSSSSAGVVSYETKEIRELIATGVVMSRVDTPQVLKSVREADPEAVNDFSIMPIPPRNRMGSSMGWVGFAAFKDGELETAKDFMEFMFQGDKLVNFYLSYPYTMFPALEALYSNNSYINGVPAELKQLVPQTPDILSNSAGTAMWNGDNPWSGEIDSKGILPDALSDMLVKGISAEEAVDKVVDEIKSLMGR